MQRESPDEHRDAEALLRAAASDHRLWSVARGRADAGDARAAVIVDTCARIHAATVAEAERLEALIDSSDVAVVPDASGQLHQLTVRCATREGARRVSHLLADDGYVPWQAPVGAAEEVFLRTNTQRTFVHLGDVTRNVVVTWPGTRVVESLPGALRPTARDWQAVELPERAWWAYFALRPLRLVKERLRGAAPAALPLGPILGTPVDLIEPLLRFAELESDDHLVDLGCGDGRVVVEAARRFGCQTTGVEQDPRLVERARARVADAGLTSRVTVHEADADTFDLTDTTVVFLFIPAESVASVAQRLRDRGFAGRIISHEQRFIEGPIAPVESRVLLGDGSLTVAHRW